MRNEFYRVERTGGRALGEGTVATRRLPGGYGRGRRSGLSGESGQTHEGHGRRPEGHGRASGKTAQKTAGQRPLSGIHLPVCSGRRCFGRIPPTFDPATRKIADSFSTSCRQSISARRILFSRFNQSRNPKKSFRRLDDFLLVGSRRQRSQNRRHPKDQALTLNFKPQTLNSI
jgi:hypothetical protein